MEIKYYQNTKIILEYMSPLEKVKVSSFNSNIVILGKVIRNKWASIT